MTLRWLGGLTALLPTGVLGSDLLHGFCLATARGLGRIGQIQGAAGTHAVDIVANEGIRIEILDCQHGLMD